MGYAAQTAKTLALSRQKVFAHLVDFGGVGKLLPDDVESVQLRGEGIGSVRSIRLKGADGALEERLEAAVDEHVMSYSLIVNTVLPVENYHAVVVLTDAPGGGCHIQWSSNWVAKGAPEAEVRAMLEGLYGKLIDGIESVG